MRRFVDLHTHSTASDGTSRPQEVVRLADEAGMAAVALTDHDTVCGLPAARAEADRFPELHFVPGVEVSARFTGGTLHIVALGIDEGAASIQRLAQQLREARSRRNPRMLQRLRALGIDLRMSDVIAAAGRGGGRDEAILGRLHMAEAMRRKGYVAGIDEAFAKYIGKGAAAYVDKERLEPAAVIAAIHEAGGVAVLAHPVQLNCDNAAQLERVVRGLMWHGLDGIEVYHADHTPQQTRQYLDLARRCGLGVTGGSDFHGEGKPGVLLGRPRVPLAAIGPQPFADRVFSRA
jgi:hypothetical protein